MGKFIDLQGHVFDRLTVKRFAGKKNGKTLWECLCLCGETTTVMTGNLRSRRTKSCGCLQASNRTKHGMAGTKIYHVWRHMLDRCNKETHDCYHNYGGRGISVCERWKSFINFYSDVGDVSKGLSIDRINNNGNYEPNNIRWATAQEQIQNSRTAKLSEKTVRFIRASYSKKKGNGKVLAGLFAVSESTVYAVVNKKSWRQIQ